jgi:hypothetical protein
MIPGTPMFQEEYNQYDDCDDRDDLSSLGSISCEECCEHYIDIIEDFCIIL